jgi:hypothetical protein
MIGRPLDPGGSLAPAVQRGLRFHVNTMRMSQQAAHAVTTLMRATKTPPASIGICALVSPTLRSNWNVMFSHIYRVPSFMELAF